MSINAPQFRQLVIEPALATLAPLGIPFTKTAADLLMATAAVETNVATWLNQSPGPALGVFQIERASLTNLYNRLTPPQLTTIHTIMTPQPLAAQIDTNLLLAAAICRLYYWQIPEPLPEDRIGDWVLNPTTNIATYSGLWGYYKQYYNTAAGKTTKSEFISKLSLTDIANLPP